MKSEKYNGKTITFTKRHGKVWAKCSSVSSQYLGVGKTKESAFRDAISSLKRIKK